MRSRDEDFAWERSITNDEDGLGLKDYELKYLRHLRQADKEIQEYNEYFPQEIT